MNEELLRGIGINITENEKLCQESFVRMKDIFYQETFTAINDDSSKLRTYSKLKVNLGIENYLLSNLKIAERTSISKLRLSNHVLMIEKGRHQNIHKTLRLCPPCHNHVETEEHFLIVCPHFSVMRNALFHKVTDTIPNFLYLSSMDKFILLLTSKNLTSLLGPYVLKLFECRSFLLEKHKNNI